jgi:hypothetical protein
MGLRDNTSGRPEFSAMGDRDDFWDDAVKSLDNATITGLEGHISDNFHLVHLVVGRC